MWRRSALGPWGCSGGKVRLGDDDVRDRSTPVGPLAVRDHHPLPLRHGAVDLAAIGVLVDFLGPRSGTYCLDDTDVADVAGRDVRQRITWIQQLPWIADSTVRENLRIADPSADDAELRAAIAAVALDGWYEHLPSGLDSPLGRGGSAMSGGEAQRLALARVLLAGHDVVVLDEPTANLDAETAAQVLDTVLDRCADRTTLLLGHAT